ncbi:VQ motif [Arabidopsis thaliana x Arabidopsis arenosa]|uniref:VQ motif n=1 Tax=Arabidopsis thaliana x Arabidopsis arenosa TaxID=1240361 RepID=A0A8T1YCE6_9BRAS|nr:VQ motif [Arabidopsis thaliana x Arabidopsis arenosa]
MANSNNDWSQFYNNQTFFTTATSTVATTTTTTSADSPLNPESRRVTKPTRRRSRASRRTPTTLFNTDTANFRAMVQQFTGGPSAVAFGSSSSSGFSLTSSDPTAGASSSGYQAPWQYANLQNQTSHHHELPQQDRPYLFSSSNHVSTLGYPNAVVSNGFVAADESKDGGGGGGGYAPSSERNSNIASWLQ